MTRDDDIMLKTILKEIECMAILGLLAGFIMLDYLSGEVDS